MNKLVLSIIFSVLLVIWLASGADVERQIGTQLVAPSTVFQVDSFASEAQLHQRSVTIRGRIDADKSVVLRSKIAGQVVATYFREGESVAEGDVICELELGDREIAAERAASAVRLAEIEYRGSLQLRSGGLQSELAMANAEDRLAAARLAKQQADLALEYTKIRAPFDGIVESLHAEKGAYLRPADVCAQILDVTPFIFSGLVSEDVVRFLAPGDQGRVLVEGLEAQTAQLRFVAHQADQVTRNYQVEAIIQNEQTTSVRAGLTAALTIPLNELLAHRIPASIISLDANGQLRVKAINDQSEVVYYFVDLIDETREGLWVTGLPDRVRLITTGSEFVAEGDVVDYRIGESN
ncbi:MAG: efflux RND transporter periplasmic adaptor subunit [Gammaproteobacteria bacterium]|nr:efflux RND transporter periplasmic adaptor subunit [Gammaproteobacteria bacterium]